MEYLTPETPIWQNPILVKDLPPDIKKCESRKYLMMRSLVMGEIDAWQRSLRIYC